MIKDLFENVSREDILKDTRKTYTIDKEAWYSQFDEHKDACPDRLYLHLSYPDGSVNGEFEITWESIGIRLHAFDDAWPALYAMPELVEFLAMVGTMGIRISIHQFAECLNELGFEDITKRERES